MLIFQNGTASFNIGGETADIDDNGLPTRSTKFDIVDIPCYIEVQSKNRQGRYDEGKYPVGTYSVSIDYDSVVDNFSPTRVQLTHERQGNLGIFTIQRIEFYDLTRTIQLWV